MSKADLSSGEWEALMEEIRRPMSQQPVRRIEVGLFASDVKKLLAERAREGLPGNVQFQSVDFVFDAEQPTELREVTVTFLEEPNSIDRPNQ